MNYKKHLFCLQCGKLLSSSEHGKYCAKHFRQLRKYGEFKDNNPRTINTPNEFRFKGAFVEMDTYGKFGIINGTYIIDAEDYPKVATRKWHSVNFKERFYAISQYPEKISLHRLVTDAKEGSVVDHIDGNTYNNSKENLRFVSHSLNCMNLSKKYGKNIYKGVHKKIKSGKYYATLQKDKKTYTSCMFSTIEEAVFARYLLEQYYVKDIIIQQNSNIIESLPSKIKEEVIFRMEEKFKHC